MKRILTAGVVVPLMGAFVMSCVTTQNSQYEVLSSKTVMGVPLEMVRRTPPSADGQSDYGILDPSEAFHHCGEQPCDDQRFESVAQSYAANSGDSYEKSGGGGGGSGGM